MSRDDGFDVADMNTGHLDDPKVKALWRRLTPSQDAMSRAMLLHLAVLLASWRQGCRVTVDEAVPVWLEPDGELVAALQSVKLLDKSRKLPIRSWNSWFGPAHDRREERRAAGRVGGLRARGKRTLADALSRAQQQSYSSADSSATAEPHLTVRPTDRPSGRARARGTVQGTNERRGLVPISELVTPEALAAAGRKP